eukprot:688470-Amphidinium_carterae.1
MAALSGNGVHDEIPLSGLYNLSRRTAQRNFRGQRGDPFRLFGCTSFRSDDRIMSMSDGCGIKTKYLLKGLLLNP